MYSVKRLSQAPEENVCCRCGETRPRAKESSSWCRPCTAEKQREYYAGRCANESDEEHDERLRRRKVYNHQVRLEALQAYGGRCECCNEAQPEFLAVDHIEGGGSAHRAALRKGGHSDNIAFWLRKRGYPAGFRVLCHNCNQAISCYGYCPHKKEV